MANDYPPAAFNFKVEFGLDGITNNNSSFQEVSGLDTKLELEELTEGGRPYVHSLPKGVKYKNLVLKRGFLSDPKIAKWIENINFIGKITTTELIVSLLDVENKPRAIWKFENVYPTKIDQGPMKINTDQIVIERLELAYNYMTRIS